MDELFSFATPDAPTATSHEDPPVRDEQIAQIRSEFERLGISSQEERKDVIEAASFRSVASLRELTAVEARRIITRLKERTPQTVTKSSGSSWDTREEDTWIDRL